MKPLALDLYCGLGGWAEGLLAAGWDVIGVDFDPRFIGRYPGQLMIQDVLTFDGRRARGKVQLVVASPPCQKYSYMAMPWTRAKTLASWYRGEVTTRIVERRDGTIVDRMETVSDQVVKSAFAADRQSELNAMFRAAFRIAEEIGCPIIVENVKGAQPWVGTAKAHYGSFYLWGDIETVNGQIVAGRDIVAGKYKFGAPVISASNRRIKFPADCGPRMWKDRVIDDEETAHAFHLRSGGNNIKNTGGSWFGQRDGVSLERNPGKALDGRKSRPKSGGWFGHEGGAGVIAEPDGYVVSVNGAGDGIKQGGEWWYDPESKTRRFSSRSQARREASAQIAKIPFPLAYHIGSAFHP